MNEHGHLLSCLSSGMQVGDGVRGMQVGDGVRVKQQMANNMMVVHIRRMRITIPYLYFFSIFQKITQKNKNKNKNDACYFFHLAKKN